MRFLPRAFVISLLILIVAPTVVSQDLSERQQLAIFALSYFGQPEPPPPPEVQIEIRGRRGSLTIELRGTGRQSYDGLFTRAFASLDQQIQSTFLQLGRFDIIGFEQRLTAESVSEFVSMLRDYQATSVEVPEAVLLGRQTFTEDDFRELAGGYVVVVPSVSWYSLIQDDSGQFVAEMETSFTFIDVEDMQTFDQFFVTTTGIDESPEAAVRDAVQDVPSELTFRIRSMEAFQLRSGVLEVNGREIALEFGRNMGLQPGDEYAIVGERVLPNGYIATSETGLIVIREVQQQFSYGYLVYANPAAQPGDQLREIPRRGVDASIYYNVFTNGIDTASVVGVRGTGSRGFFQLRPHAALEVPFRGLVGDSLLPLNLLVGGEWNLYAGRIRLTPSAAVGVGGAIPLSDDPSYESFYLSHIGGQIRAEGSLLVTRDIYINVDVGLGYWIGLAQDVPTALSGPLSSYGGLIIGGGITLK